MFDSEPEAQLNGRVLYQPRGKVLGGTSSINGMVYMRGTPTDYDGWRQRGCEGWAYDDVLPFFKKAEDQERGADEFHGTGGPLHVSNPVRCALGDAMVQAAVEAGIPANDDFNGARQEGVGYYQTTTTNRRRWSSARAYLGAAKGRANLTVATEVAPVWWTPMMLLREVSLYGQDASTLCAGVPAPDGRAGACRA